MQLGVLNPAGAAALVAVGVLVLLHLRGRRRRVVPVSTLFLWRRVPAHAIDRRRFRPDLLFLAQLLLLLALIGGYLRPFVAETASPADRVRLLIVLDTSASMQTEETGGTRFELARRRARALVAQLLTGDEVMLVAAADRAHVVLAWTADHVRAQGRLEALEPLDTPTRLASALELALGEARARPETEIVVLTDLPREAAGVTVERLAVVDWVQIGRADDNVAVAGLAVDEPPFRPAGDATATIFVRNHGSALRRVTLEATVDGSAWARRELTLGPRAVEPVLLAEPPAAGRLVVTLVSGGGALAVDDRAVGWIAGSPTLDVLLVSDSQTLAATLREVVAAVPDGRLEVLAPARWSVGAPPAARVVVFDRFAPDAPPGPTPVLYVEPPAGNAACPRERDVEDAAIVDWDGDHPALRGLEALHAITLPRTARLVAPDWGRSLVLAATTTDAFPFLVAGERDGRRVACLGTEPDASSDDLPLLVLLLGTLRWLEEAPDAAPLVVATGEPLLLPAGTDVDAHDTGLRVAGDPPVLVAERVGLHRFGRRWVAANLFDDRESDIGRAGGAEWPAARVALSGVGGSPREIAWWLYAAGAALLVAEWLLWRRRARGTP